MKRFDPGTVIELKDARGMKIPEGSQGVIVSPTRFPDLLRQLQEKFKDEPPTTIENFVAVEWVAEPTFRQDNGFYARRRFEAVDSPKA